MVYTRSKTKQTHLEDYTANNSTPNASDPSPQKLDLKISKKDAGSLKKRKAPPASSPKPPTKRSKPSKAATSPQENDPVIMIIRAPVLHLWAASVTHFLYPSLPWSTCISAGSAISTICAVAKGRSIGKVSERDDSDTAQRKRQDSKRKQKQKDLDEVHVMHFQLRLKDGLAIVGSEKKGKLASEENLEEKFREGAYERVKERFEEVLWTWEGEEEELSREAFGFYEGFRPTVKGGQKGWGRKGELDLDTVRSTVRKR